ncbi:hypothetical protein AUJ16_04455 [Candidatus Micrarchaeota archaeon CG1_02_60_51]|nr:MAG: hypothetical protein AUJ16_04455 [Candidatus Micrarchaeota archaeon CG1_02_60_51]
MGGRLSRSEINRKNEITNQISMRPSVDLSKKEDEQASVLAALRGGRGYGGYTGRHLKSIFDGFSNGRKFQAFRNFAASKVRRRYVKAAVNDYVDLLLSEEPASSAEHYRLLREKKSGYEPLFLYLHRHYPA